MSVFGQSISYCNLAIVPESKIFKKWKWSVFEVMFTTWKLLSSTTKVKKYRRGTVEEIEVIKRNTEENKLSREKAAAVIFSECIRQSKISNSFQ